MNVFLMRKLCLPALFALEIGADHVLPDHEVSARWSTLRESLKDIHIDQASKARHPHNPLNHTAADFAVHSHAVPEGDYVYVQSHDPIPFAYLNTTNPSPLRIPLKALAKNVLFGGNETLPTMIPQQVRTSQLFM